MENQSSDMEKLYLAMRLQVEWRKMRTACHNRSNCEGCPYSKHKLCEAMSTEEILEKTTNVYYEYLEKHPV